MPERLPPGGSWIREWIENPRAKTEGECESSLKTCYRRNRINSPPKGCGPFYFPRKFVRILAGIFVRPSNRTYIPIHARRHTHERLRNLPCFQRLRHRFRTAIGCFSPLRSNFHHAAGIFPALSTLSPPLCFFHRVNDAFTMPQAFSPAAQLLSQSRRLFKILRFIWLIHRNVVILQADYYQPLE